MGADRHIFRLEALEPRVLLSGDGAVAAADAPPSQDDALDGIRERLAEVPGLVTQIAESADQLGQELPLIGRQHVDAYDPGQHVQDLFAGLTAENFSTPEALDAALDSLPGTQAEVVSDGNGSIQVDVVISDSFEKPVTLAVEPATGNSTAPQPDPQATLLGTWELRLRLYAVDGLPSTFDPQASSFVLSLKLDSPMTTSAVLEAQNVEVHAAGSQSDAAGQVQWLDPISAGYAPGTFDGSVTLTAQLVDTLRAANAPPEMGIASVTVDGLPDYSEQGPGPIIDAQVQLPFDDEEVAGAIEVVLPDPINSNRVFVGTVNGGVWRTDNAHADHVAWTPLTDQFAGLSIGDLKFSPLDPSNTLFAGIGRFSSRSSTGGARSGVLRSTDGGNSWVSLGESTFAGLNIRSIIPTSIAPDRTVATQVVFAGTDGGIFKSADGGATWIKLSGRLGTSDGVDNNGNGVVDETGEFNNADGQDQDRDGVADDPLETEPADGRDNNGNGTIDEPGEYNNPDGVDNDFDGRIDDDLGEYDNPDGLDNDGDGLTDEAPEINNFDQLDNNGNGIVDEYGELNNPDGLDNDGDGVIDEVGEVNENDGFDNNGNGVVDEVGELNKPDGLDNDGDGLVDEVAELNRADGIDNNGNAIVDEYGEANNADGLDNDGDGAVDERGERNNPDGFDNNGNGLFDERREVNRPDGVDNDVNGLTDEAAELSLPNTGVSHLVIEEFTSAPNSQTVPRYDARLYTAIPGQGVFRSALNQATVPIGSDLGSVWIPINNGISTAVFVDGLDNDGDGATDEPGEPLQSSSRIELSVHEITGVSGTISKSLWVAFISPDGGSSTKARLTAFFRSGDRGDNWMQLPLPGDGGAHPGGQGNTHFSLLADPRDADAVWLGGDRDTIDPFTGQIFLGLYNAIARTFTWQRVSGDSAAWGISGPQAPHADSRDLALSGGDILEVDDGGIYRLHGAVTAFAAGSDEDLSYTGTPIWTSMNGILRITEFVSAAWDSNHNTVFGGTQDNATVEQPGEDELEWDQVLSGDGGIVQVAQREDDLGTYSVYFETGQYLGDFRRKFVRDGAPDFTDDVDLKVTGGGFNNAPLASIDASLGARLVIPYVLNAVSSNRMLIGTNNLYESSNDGDDLFPWGVMNNLATNTRDDDGDGRVDEDPSNGVDDDMDGQTDEESGIMAITALAYGGWSGGVANAEAAWVAAGNLLRLRTTAGGAFAVTAYAGGNIVDIALDPDDWRRAYVIDGNGRVFVTPDAGTTWMNITGDLTLNTRDLRAIEIVKPAATPGKEVVLIGAGAAAAQGNVFLSGSGGVYRTFDPTTAAGGVPTWTRYGRNLPNAIVGDLRYNASDDLLLVGTQGRSAWVMYDVRNSILAPGVLKINGDTDQPDQNDVITLRRSPNNVTMLDVFLNGGAPALSVPVSVLSSIEVYGLGGDDTLILDLANGNFIPRGGFLFDGGADAGGGDKLSIVNAGGSFVLYTPSATAPGSGTVVVGGRPGAFLALEPIFVSGAPVVTLITPNGDDDIVIDSPEAGQARISGGSGGVAFENIVVAGATTVTLDLRLNDAAAGDDLVTTTAGVPLAVPNTQFIVLAGAGSGNDVLNVDADGHELVFDHTHMTVTGSKPVLLTEIDRINLTRAGVVIVVGDAAGNTLAVVAAAPTAGTLRLDTGPVVHFDTIQRLVYDARGGADLLGITNPAATIFAPPAGIHYDGGGQAGDALGLFAGGSPSFTETYTVGPGLGDGLIQFSGPVSLALTFTGLSPITDTVAVATLTAVATNEGNTIVLDNGATLGDGFVHLAIDGFEPMDFWAKAALVLSGIGGNDLINAMYSEPNSGIGALTIDGGTGDDMVTLTNGVPIGATILGGDGNDSIYANDRNNFLFGGAGRDLIFAGAGQDDIHGGDGDDLIQAGAGNDTAAGDDGADVILGGLGDDTLLGGAGDDFLQGDEGGDRIEGEAGHDQLFGMQGIDVLFGGEGDDWMSGGDGVDELHGGADNDTLLGDTGDDLVFGDDGADRMYGGLGDDLLRGGPGADTLWGEAGIDSLFGEDGNDRLDGGEGDDQLSGDADDDYLDGGSGTDVLSGGPGNDELLGGGGVGDTLAGDDGDDILRGSNDGADIITGGSGRDRLLGNGGNDSLSGGADDDILDGGAGDDLISGDAGSDLLLGGAGHDTLYGQNAAASGDDNAVDELYGDFGTNGNEAGSGGDRLFGQGGNDRLYGEGGDDLIQASPGLSVVEASGGAGNLVDFGSGEGAVPGDFIAPAPTPPPAVLPSSPSAVPAATLPAGADYAGRWSEFAGSATGEGLTAGNGLALEAAVAAKSGESYVAWSDSRNGNFEIYIARHTAAGWSELAGSAHGGGVSNSANESRRPAVAFDSSGNLVVAWTEFNGAASDIRVARFDAGSNGWVALGPSLGAGGISATGAADQARIVNTAAGTVVAWLDASSGGVANVYLRRYDGAAWLEVNSGALTSASGSGVSRSATSVSDAALATDGGKVAVAWTQNVSGNLEIYLRELSGASWSELAGSASGGGISVNAGASAAPSLTYFGGTLFAAWQDLTSGNLAIYARRFSGGVWAEAGFGAASGGGLSGYGGSATQPQLVGDATALQLLWVDNRLGNTTANLADIFARKWNASSFVEPLAGDASYRGIHSTGTSTPLALALASDGAGHPWVAWSDLGSGHAETYVRGNLIDLQRVFSADAVTSIQSLLDSQDLGTGDVIVVEPGVFASGFTIAAGDAGVILLGRPGGTVAIQGAVSVTSGSSDRIVVQNLTFTGGVTLSGASAVTLIGNTFVSPLTVDGGDDTYVVHNAMASSGGAALTLTGGAGHPVVEHNQIAGGATGIAIAGTGAVDVEIRGNTLQGSATGIALLAAAEGYIGGNDVSAIATALNVAAPFGGVIEENDIHHAAVGVAYGAPASLSANEIHDNGTGVTASVAGIVDAFGFVGTTLANEIHGNATGVQLAGRMRGQHIYENTVGVSGSGLLGGDTAEEPANLIESNGTGVDFSGTVQFNDIARNTIGVAAQNGQLIAHNRIYRNTQAGVLVSGKSDVRIVNNTFYAPEGDNVRLQSASSNVQVLNNVLWAESGYDLYVANDSQGGFWSDYNNLYATGAGRIAFWTKDFTDILDFQADVARFDLHSSGATAVNPWWADAPFLNRAWDDYRTFGLLAAQRLSDPTADAADPRTDLGLPAFYDNLLANSGFEAGLAGWGVNDDATTRSGSPAAFEGAGYFYARGNSKGFAEQTIDLLAAGFSAASLDAQDLVAVFGGRVRSLGETPIDQGQILLTFLDQGGVVIGEAIFVKAENASDRWELVGGRAHLPVGTRSVRYRFESDRQTGATTDSFVDAAFLYVVADAVAPNQGAYGNTGGELLENVRPRIALRFPDLYTDWEREQFRDILWESHNNAAESAVRIDLYQDGADGPQWLLNLATATADDGVFSWSPAGSGIAFGTHGLRIQIAFVGDLLVLDRSSETFSVPEDGSVYWVDDASNANDEYTPAAAGSNRNTGKLATAPKPNPVNVLRTYELSSGAVLNVDTGLYPLIFTMALTAKAGGSLGADRGFLLRGPTDAAKVAGMTTAIPNNTAQTLIDLDDADLMQIRFLTLTGGKHGIHLTGVSTGFTAERVTILSTALHGLFIEGGSDFTLLKDVTASGAAGNNDGVAIVGGAGGAIQNLTAASNRYGLSVNGATQVNIAVANLFGNRSAGLRTDGNTNGTWDSVSASGNPTGIQLVGFGNMAISNARLFDNTNVGLWTSGYGSPVTVSQAEVFGNGTGVELYRGEITGSRIYNNSGVGLYSPAFGLVVRGNTIYSNDIGLLDAAGNGGAGAYAIANNLFYGHRTAALRLTSYIPTNFEIVNNTIYEPAADAIYAGGAYAVRGVHLRNNIVWTQAGYGIRIENNSQQGFQSNYNLLQATGAGKVGFWQGDRLTLAQWQNANFQDADSLTGDPLFVDVDGADGIVGAVGFQGLTATFFANGTLSGSAAGTVPVPGIDTPAFSGAPDPRVADDNWSGRWSGYLRLDAPGVYQFFIDSLGPQRLLIDGQPVIVDFSSPSGTEQSGIFSAAGAGFVTIAYEIADDGGLVQPGIEWIRPGGAREAIPAARYTRSAVAVAVGQDDNFHEQSLYGSFKPGVGFTADAAQSPAIDRGAPSDAFDNEPADNGGYINLGAYGNTAEASKSQAQYVRVTNPNGGERLPQESSFEIRWRSHGFAGNVKIEVSTNGGAAFETLGADEPNDDSFLWDIVAAQFPVSDQYIIRVSSSDVSDVSDAVFAVTLPLHLYYVNDGDTAGDEYSTATGNDANDGQSPGSPKASIRAVLETYDLNAGDTILVDTGVYVLTVNILIGNGDSGVRIQGPVGEGHEALLDRGNRTLSTARVFELTDADDVTLSALAVTGAYDGIYVSGGSTGFTLERSRVFENNSTGLNIVDAASSGALVQDSVFYGNAAVAGQDQDYGVLIKGTDPTVLRNESYHLNMRDGYGDRRGIHLENVGANAVVRDNLVHDNGISGAGYGLVVTGTGFDISGNVARDNARGFYFSDTDGGAVLGRAHDNVAYGNGTNGFELDRAGIYEDNEAYDNGTGISASLGLGGTVARARVWRNTIGVSMYTGGGMNAPAILRDSQVYGNSDIGVYVFARYVIVSGNSVHDNATGVHVSGQGPSGGGPVPGIGLRNNVIYNNRLRGVLLQDTNFNYPPDPLIPVLDGNTVYEPNAHAVEVIGATYYVQLRNNILWAGGAGHYVISVAGTAQTGFASDYNDLHATDGAQVALWQVPIATLADWRFELGFDVNSISADPLFVAPEGTDGVRGLQDFSGLRFEGFANPTFSGTPAVAGVDRVIDIAPTGSGLKPGLNYFNSSVRWSGEVFLPVAGDYTFFIKSLEPQRLTVSGTSVIDDFDVPSRAERSGVFTAVAPGWVTIVYDVSDITSGLVQAKLEWTTPDQSLRRLIRAYEVVGAGAAGIAAEHQVLRYQADPSTTGADDDFHLSSTAGSWHGGTFEADEATSPAIDAGDPASAFAAESAANGARINLGFEGNTAQASRSPATLVQVIAPNGLDKLLQGQTVTILWHSDGVGQPAPYRDVVLGDLPFAYYRLGEPSGTGAADASGNGRTGTYQNGVSLGLAGALPTDTDTAAQFDGTNDYVLLPPSFADFTGGFSAELWVYPTSVGSYQRFFDLGGGAASDNILLAREGTTSNLLFQVYSGSTPGGVVRATGAIELNVWQHFAVTLDGTGQVVLYKNGEAIATGSTAVPRNLSRASSLVGKSNWSDAPYAGKLDELSFYDRALTGEQVRSHYRSLDLGAVDIDLMQGGNAVLAIAAGTANDGRFVWTVPNAVAPASDYRIRIRSTSVPAEDLSDQPFLIGANNHTFYVNDGSVAGDEYATAPGDNANTGTSPADPVLSIVALLSAYDLEPGDRILVDTGAYLPPGNIVIANADSGVEVRGPVGAGHAALFDRGNRTLDTARVFDLNNADDVTLAWLAVTGAYDGIYVANGSSGFTLEHSLVFQNNNTGLFIADAASSGALVQDNVFHGDAAVAGPDQNWGVLIRGADPTVLRNEAYHTNAQSGGDRRGIVLENVGANAVVRDNLLRDNGSAGNGYGLVVSGTGFDISGNVARDNGRGFYFADTDGGAVQGRAHDNVAYGNSASGFELDRSGLYEDNEAFDNGTGITASLGLGGTVARAHVWRNTTGVTMYSGGGLDAPAILRDSQIYGSSDIGVYVFARYVIVSGNSVHDNATGVHVSGSNYSGGGPVPGIGLRNNLIYNNRLRGVLLQDTDFTFQAQMPAPAFPVLDGNTVYEPNAHAVEITGGSYGVQMRNNVLVAGGAGHFVVTNSDNAQRLFASDYNDLYAIDGAQVGYWQMALPTLSAWVWELGFDKHSISADPLFVDPDGADGVRGFRDNSGLRFEGFNNATFSGTPLVTGVDRVIDIPSTGGGLKSGLATDGTSVRWSGQIYLPLAGDYTFYAKALALQRLTIDGMVVIDDFAGGRGSQTEQSGVFAVLAPGWVSIAYEVVDSGFPNGGVAQARLEWTSPDNVVRRLLRARETLAAGADAVANLREVLRYQADPGTTGADDDFHLSSTEGSWHGGTFAADAVTSQAIDAGDPGTAFMNETDANGARRNLGFDGNTAQASHSPAAVVQVLSPDGLDKLLQGQTVPILWHTDGLGQPAPYQDVVLADEPIAYYRLGEANGTAAADLSGNNLTGTYLNGVTLGTEGSPVAGADTAAQFDGTNDYLQLPAGFADFTNGFSAEVWLYPTAVGTYGYQRVFDLSSGASVDNILLAREGTTNNLIFQVYSGNVGGGLVRASSAIELNVWQHFAVTMDSVGQVVLYKNGEPIAAGTTSVPRNLNRTTNLVGKSNSGDPLFAGRIDELAFFAGALTPDQVRSHYRSLAAGAVDIELVRGDATVLSIATGVRNTGRSAWTVPMSATPAGDYRMRVRAAGLPVEDLSDMPFLIAANGHNFYVNDGSLSGDRFTTAPGDNANSGATPADPVRSVYTLLHMYDLGPGDVIHVDTGSYHVPINIRLGPEDSGITIEGPGAPGTALLDRSNTTGGPNDDNGHYVIEIAGASDVTIRALSLTNAESGLRAVGAARLRVENAIAFNNENWGFYADNASVSPVFEGNQAYGTTGDRAKDQDTGFEIRSTSALVEGNIAFKIGVQYGTGFALGNTSGAAEIAGMTVRNNLAHNNATGFSITTFFKAEVYGNETRDNDLGLYIVDYDASVVSLLHDNDVHDNDVQGIVADRSVDVFSNDVRDNDGTGIVGTSGALVRNNRVSGSTTGISASGGARVVGNRVFGNSGSGIVSADASTDISNNVVYSNGVGLEVNNYQARPVVVSNLVYDNANAGIFVHDAGLNSGNAGMYLFNNTVYQDVGSAIKFQNNGPNVRLFNNVIVINGGLGIEVIGGVTGFQSDRNDIFLATAGASVGRWIGTTAADLAAWTALTGADANSLSADPLFIDIDGADNLLGWDRPTPADPFADYGSDDNFHVRAHSPAIDAADSAVAPALDADGLGRADDPATPNTGVGASAFYDLGAFEFQGSSDDTTPPTVVGLSPMGLGDNAVVRARLTSLLITFSEPLDTVSARSRTLYALIEAGPNGLFDDSDDVRIDLVSAAYTAGAVDVTLSFDAELPQGLYRLSLLAGLVDRSGNALDGDGNGSAGGNFVRTFRIDLPPEVVATRINDGSVQRSRVTSVSLGFSEDVSSGFTLDDVRLLNVTTGDLIPAAAMALSFEANGTWATVTFPGMPDQKLPDGDYRLVIAAGTVADTDGQTLEVNFILRAHVLTGDANGDGVTNESDLYQVWQNLLKAPQDRDPNDDLNGDGQVDVGDVNVVKSNYAATTPPSGALLGDVNADGVTGDLDLYLVWQNLLRPEADRDLGYDLDGDGLVTMADVDVVRANYLAAAPAAPALVAVPSVAVETQPATVRAAKMKTLAVSDYSAVDMTTRSAAIVLPRRWFVVSRDTWMANYGPADAGTPTWAERWQWALVYRLQAVRGAERANEATAWVFRHFSIEEDSHETI
jgi:hypothetical protein